MVKYVIHPNEDKSYTELVLLYGVDESECIMHDDVRLPAYNYDALIHLYPVPRGQYHEYLATARECTCHKVNNYAR